MAEQDVELLVGKNLPADTFSDINIGRSLDAIFNAGPSKIITELGIRASGKFALNMTAASYDTTSTNVWGDYRDCEGDFPPPGSCITWGYLILVAAMLRYALCGKKIQRSYVLLVVSPGAVLAGWGTRPTASATPRSGAS